MANLTDDQIAEYKEAFRLFDPDGDGTITIKELTQIMSNLGEKKSEAEIQDMLNKYGSNGEIDFGGFIKLMGDQAGDNTDNERIAEYKEAFRVFDPNGDGYIGANELAHVMTNLGEKKSEAEIQDMMDKYGSNGGIDFEGFIKLMASR